VKYRYGNLRSGIQLTIGVKYLLRHSFHHAVSYFYLEVTIHTLPHLECIWWISLRSSHLRFEMLLVLKKKPSTFLIEHLLDFTANRLLTK